MKPQVQSGRGTYRQSQQQTQNYDTFIYKFQQQIITAWKPVPHPSSNVLLYTLLTAICLSVGIALIIAAPSTQQVYIRYDNTCQINSICTFNFTLSNSLEPPIFLYYGLVGFYQNHRRYLKYFSKSQLSSGSPLSENDARKDCASLTLNSELQFTQYCPRNNSNCVPIASKPQDVGFPCGTRAKAYNKIRPQIMSINISYGNNRIQTRRQGIAWPQDVGSQKNYDVTKQPFDVQQQEWLVWYRPAARKQFYKLHRIFDSRLEAGNYSITLNNTFPSPFGQKWINISKSNFQGNRDLFLGIAFTCLGGICLILCFVFIAKWVNQKRQKAKLQ